MLKVAIVDDERAVREELKYLLKFEDIEFEISEYENASLFLESFLTKRFDLIFLDMHLGDMEGIKVAKMIRQKNKDVLIVFATAYDCYALEAFDIGAVDYLLKPFEPKRFHEMMTKVTDRLSVTDKNENFDILTINTSKKMIILRVLDIIYIESVQRKTIIVTKSDIYETSYPLSDLEVKLFTKSFFRVHKSYIINLRAIKEIHTLTGQNYYIILKNREEVKIPVSRQRIKSLVELVS